METNNCNKCGHNKVQFSVLDPDPGDPKRQDLNGSGPGSATLVQLHKM